MQIQSLYQETIKYAASKHHEVHQKVPGTDLPYVVHLSNVAMEILMAAPHTGGFRLDLAIQIALLHDTLEDTNTTYDELENRFGIEIASAVRALTKNKQLPAADRMSDCLRRIKELPREVWAVKMADRITNLQPPPAHWDKEKRIVYRDEALIIWQALREGNKYLAERLKASIEKYGKYFAQKHL